MEKKGKRIVKILFILLFVLFESFNVIITAEEDTIREKHSLPHQWITVGIHHADYTSIQEAIDQASPESTIYLTQGVYTEILHITKHIHLIGENKKTTIIRPTSTANSFAIHIAASHVSIQNVHISNNAPGIYTTAVKISQPFTTIDSCTFSNTPIGIACWSSNNTIRNSEFYQCRDEGIALLGSTHNKCNQNSIKNCVFYDNCDGIELQYSSYNRITKCTFYNQTHAAIDAIGQHNNNNIISTCKIHEQQAYGIFLVKSSDNKIVECTITSLTIKESYKNTLQNCEVDDISISSDSHLLIEQNGDEPLSHPNPELSQQIHHQYDPLPTHEELPYSSPHITLFFHLILHNQKFKSNLQDYLLRIQEKNHF